ncbi:unnamed protein product [Amoebophrya sp. A120]|nr:unnamed protein product [Amoebophrya sp. A120]|eukprot:GSA120T00024307001.1
MILQEEGSKSTAPTEDEDEHGTTARGNAASVLGHGRPRPDPQQCVRTRDELIAEVASQKAEVHRQTETKKQQDAIIKDLLRRLDRANASQDELQATIEKQNEELQEQKSTFEQRIAAVHQNTTALMEKTAKDLEDRLAKAKTENVELITKIHVQKVAAAEDRRKAAEEEEVLTKVAELEKKEAQKKIVESKLTTLGTEKENEIDTLGKDLDHAILLVKTLALTDEAMTEEQQALKIIQDQPEQEVEPQQSSLASPGRPPTANPS